MPQPPQFSGSRRVFVQVPPQFAAGAVHAHEPPTHEKVASQV